MRIYRLTDRIRAQIGELVFTLAPLDYFQKRQISQLSLENKMEEAVLHSIRCSVKHIEGLEDCEGNEYELEFENGIITDQCLREFLGAIPSSDLLQAACVNLATKILTDDTIKGVKILSSEVKKKKIKK